MHIIGGFACPIMCCFIAEGHHRNTKNIGKYTVGLFVFAFAYAFEMGVVLSVPIIAMYDGGRERIRKSINL